MFPIEHKPTCGDAKFVSFNDLNPTHQTIPSLGFLYDDIKQLSGYNFVDIQPLMSCNGLLLCLVFFCSIPWDYVDHPLAKYCVCNPTTKKLRWLPLGPFFHDHILNSYLAFDPSLSLHYKVIYTKHFLCDNNPHEIYIYSSENQYWSTYASPFYPCEEWFFLNGSMYCAEKSLHFDVYTEKMEQITMPPRMANCRQKYLPVIGSHLYCVVTRNHMMADLQVHDMRSDFSRWVPKYDGNIPGFKVVYIFNPMCVIEGVKEGESELVLGIPGKLISYNLKRKTTKELCALHGGMSYTVARVYLFIECLYDV